MEKDKIIFSGAQPTGSLTLGNYIGAIQNWKALEDDYQCLYSIVDLHSLTIRHNPEEFKNKCLSFLVQYLACGLDPDKNIIFFQSNVTQHPELSWILNCFTYIGELNRMTQFKEKAEKNKDNINAGLFTYPVLQAADILLYQTNLVPVGEDQKQHLELTRDIALRFNQAYGETFTIPEVYIPKVGAKIMSLQEPNKKMSKSDEDTNGTIFLMDSEDIIVKKIKRAVTDTENKIAYTDNQPGVKNLITIFATLGNYSINQVEEMFEGKGYGSLKAQVAELVVESVRPFKVKYDELIKNPDYVAAVHKRGAERAAGMAEATMKKVREKLGLVV
ncbi:tryptophan--tRNA ligase [Alkaliphilus pronyensis]|uniref:Tryptophan--tRNA ligase n=1 Tax=Alkaliphilus pronyensis TaxID=1482732 RepID=A0A6I0F6W6_9FIRM|nr:tryptophan--tRNA ligase [Alkaliphilus pronyensis]KAB3537715.1 tryptophan--tRNA ligase [Alkaliphilus pronyensis]